jgi:hypothetical protein
MMENWPSVTRTRASRHVEEQSFGKLSLTNAGSSRTPASSSIGRVADIGPLHPEDDGIDRLHDGDWEIGGFDGARIDIMQVDLRGENLGAPLAAEEHDPLVEYAKARDLGAPAHKGERFAPHLVEIAEIDGIVPLIESDFLDIYRDVQKLG